MRRILTSLLLISAACGTTIRVEPLRVEPIRMTIDVNVHSAADASPAAKPADAH
jgi:hypothetical protein